VSEGSEPIMDVPVNAGARPHPLCSCGGIRAVGLNTRGDAVQVLGAAVLALLVTACVSTPVWYALRRILGKRNTWLLWSLTMACTNPMFAFIGKGDVKCEPTLPPACTMGSGSGLWT
jgi:hypothetical protein